MAILKLWLIRHGESSINAGIWSTNPAQVSLTALGKKQAQQAAAQIEEPPSLIISSALTRAQESAKYIKQAWPNTPTQTWPIQEIIYLSPQRLQALSAAERKKCVEAYWENSDPWYRDGDDAESFAEFMHRVQQFHQRLSQQHGFVIVVGHGQFFKAFQLGLTDGWQITSAWMQRFRQQEMTQRIQNSELIKLELTIPATDH